MLLLGLDYGEKRIGLAIGDDETRIASPLKILKNKGSDFVIKEIQEVCQKDGIEKIIVGLPLTLSSEEGIEVKEVLKFIDELKNGLSIPVETEDERMTSAMVDKLMSEAGGISERDAVAAMIILQSYLDKPTPHLPKTLHNHTAELD